MKDFSAARSALQSVPSLPELTNREREVLALIAEYRTNTEIAWRLGLSGSDPLAANLR